MANTSSAKKALRVSLRKNKINTKIKDDMKAERKSVNDALAKNDVETGKKNLGYAYSKIDTAVKKGVLHANTGSRYKSRLAAAVKKADQAK